MDENTSKPFWAIYRRLKRVEELLEAILEEQRKPAAAEEEAAQRKVGEVIAAAFSEPEPISLRCVDWPEWASDLAILFNRLMPALESFATPEDLRAFCAKPSPQAAKAVYRSFSVLQTKETPRPKFIEGGGKQWPATHLSKMSRGLFHFHKAVVADAEVIGIKQSAAVSEATSLLHLAYADLSRDGLLGRPTDELF